MRKSIFGTGALVFFGLAIGAEATSGQAVPDVTAAELAKLIPSKATRKVKASKIPFEGSKLGR